VTDQLAEVEEEEVVVAVVATSSVAYCYPSVFCS
jgi:hypothetical protein